MPVGIIASGAAASGWEVNLFFTFWGLNALRKDMLEKNTVISKEFESYAPAIMDAMKKMNYPPWFELVKQAKEVGEVKVFACSTTMEMMGVKREMLPEFVDDIVGVATFLDRAEGGITLFI